MATPLRPSRRRFLLGSALAGSAGLAVGARGLWTPGPAAAAHAGHSGAPPKDGDGRDPHDDAHGGGHDGPTFRTGQTVDHEANGFHPTKILRDFDYGKVSTLPDGRVLREWEVFASDEDIEVAPGVRFAAWTFDSRSSFTNATYMPFRPWSRAPANSAVHASRCVRSSGPS